LSSKFPNFHKNANSTNHKYLIYNAKIVEKSKGLASSHQEQKGNMFVKEEKFLFEKYYF
jgi:hypothetical protein